MMEFVLGLQNAQVEDAAPQEEGDSLSSVLSTNCCNSTKAEEV